MDTIKNSRLIKAKGGEYVTAYIETARGGVGVNVSMNVFFVGHPTCSHRSPLPAGMGGAEWLDHLTRDHATAFVELTKITSGITHKRQTLPELTANVGLLSVMRGWIALLPHPFKAESVEYIDLVTVIGMMLTPDINPADKFDVDKFVLEAAKKGYDQQAAREFLEKTIGIPNMSQLSPEIDSLIRQMSGIGIPPPPPQPPSGSDPTNKVVPFKKPSKN